MSATNFVFIGFFFWFGVAVLMFPRTYQRYAEWVQRTLSGRDPWFVPTVAMARMFGAFFVFTSLLRALMASGSLPH